MLSDVTTTDDKTTILQENLVRAWREALYSLRGKLDGVARATLEANMIPHEVRDHRLIFSFQKKNCFADPVTLALVSQAYQQLFGFTGEILSVPKSNFAEADPQDQDASPTLSPSASDFPARANDHPAATPQQAWETCKDQLRTEMSKSPFDAWVAPAQFVDYAEGIFTLGLESQYAIEWVESRLVSTIERNLAGLLARPVHVSLVLLPSATEGRSPTPPPTPDFPAKDGPAPPANSPPRREQPLWMKEKTDSLLALILRPNRVIGLPGYLLRWLPYLGGTGLSILTGLRQSFYHQYHTLAVARREFEASAPEVAALSGVAKSTFWRMIDSPSMRWFIERVPLAAGENQWFLDPQTGAAKRHVNKFCFVNTIPLTPGDADRLGAALQTAGANTQPAEALRTLLAMEPREYLGPMHQAPPGDWTDRDPTLTTVEAVFLQVSSLGPEALTPDLYQLVEQLSLAILRPTTDVVLISQYFWNHWLPRLGHNPGWIVIALRDRGFASASTGEVRERVFLRGGYQELADLLGIQRVKTVREWLPAASAQKPVDETRRPGDDEYQAWLQKVPAHSDPYIDATRRDLGRFLRVAGGERESLSPKDPGALHLWVREGSEPLIPEDDLAYRRLLEVVDQFLQAAPGERAAYLDTLGLLGGNRTHAESQAGGNKTHPPADPGGNRTDPPGPSGGNETDGETGLGGNEPHALETAAEIGRLKSLGGLRFLSYESLKTYFEHLQSLSLPTITGPDPTEIPLPVTTHPEFLTDTEEVVGEGHPVGNIPEAWDIEKLLGIIGAPKIRDQLRKSQVTAAAIVSCLLYISSDAGGKMGIGYLAVRLRQDPLQGQGGSYLRLAELPPEKLWGLITGSLKPYHSQMDSSGYQALWKRTMGHCPKEKLVLLLEYLGFDMVSFRY